MRPSAAVRVPDTASPVETAAFVARENRFVVQARRTTGELVRAYLPNTARLSDLLVPEAAVLLQPNEDPARRTRWTVTRVWDGTWVSLEAGVASRLVADHLGRTARFADWPPVMSVTREVRVGDHRLDLALEVGEGADALVEVKSLSRVRSGVAPLSSTPSSRGRAQLELLGRLAAHGRRVGVAFVVQRADAERLDLGAPADPGWRSAIATALQRGLTVVAYRCTVGPTATQITAAIPVVGATDLAARPTSP